MSGRTITDEEKERVRAMFHANMTYEAIAEAVGRTPHAVKQMVSRHGLSVMGEAAKAFDPADGYPQPSAPRRFSWEAA